MKHNTHQKLFSFYF